MQLGLMHSDSFAKDPKHLSFVLARYHFVARMLAGRKSVLEIGCGDMTGAHVVRPAVGKYLGIDREDYGVPGRHDFISGDILDGPVLRDPAFDGIFALDVLEHIAPDMEDAFFHNIVRSATSDVAVVIGLPSLESQPYASELSKRYHVNCKTEEGLRGTLSWHFRNVFLFGMNDSTLHTGYGPMCHYRLAICTGPR